MRSSSGTQRWSTRCERTIPTPPSARCGCTSRSLESGCAQRWRRKPRKSSRKAVAKPNQPAPLEKGSVMTYRPGTLLAAVAIVAAAFASIIHGASKNFAPDVVFAGSSLTGWQPIGQASWRAENGEIIGTPSAASGGWLLADRSYQDVAVFASFRCAAGCQTGVLLRAERTADGGMKGVFVSLNEGDLAAYRVTLDRQGAQTSKERLRGPGGGQLRVALPPPSPAPPAAGGRAGGPSRSAAVSRRNRVAHSAAEHRSSRAATGTPSSWCSTPTSFARFSTTRQASATRLPSPSTARTVRSRCMSAEPAKCGSRMSRTRIFNREWRSPKRCRASSGCRR